MRNGSTFNAKPSSVKNDRLFRSSADKPLSLCRRRPVDTVHSNVPQNPAVRASHAAARGIQRTRLIRFSSESLPQWLRNLRW